VVEDDYLLHIIKSSNKISDFLYYKNVKCDLHYYSIAKARHLDHSLNFVLIKPCSMIDIELFFLIVHRGLELFFLIICRSYELFFVLCCSDSLDLFFNNLLLRLLLFFAATLSFFRFFLVVVVAINVRVSFFALLLIFFEFKL
jgi:hypothetical protein